MAKLDLIEKKPKKKVRSQDVVDFFRDVLFGSSFKYYPEEDAIKQEYIAFITIKILQIIALSLIPVGLFISVLARQSKLTETIISNYVNGISIGLYTVSLFSIFLGLIMPKFTDLKLFLDFPREKVLFIALGARNVCFILPIIFASILLVEDTSWITAIPLYVLVGIALGITFPTKKRWGKYMNWSSLLD